MKRNAGEQHYHRRALAGVLMALVVPGCFLGPRARASYVQTGPQRAPLAAEAPVAVFLTGRPARCEELGVVEVAGSRLANRVARAQAEARKRGGNAVVALSSWVQVDESSSTQTVETKDGEGKVIATQSVPVSSTTSTPFQTFVVVRLLGRPVADAPPSR